MQPDCSESSPRDWRQKLDAMFASRPVLDGAQNACLCVKDFGCSSSRSPSDPAIAGGVRFAVKYLMTPMRTRPTALMTAAALIGMCLGLKAAGVYPATITAAAKAVDGSTTVTSTITIKIDSLIDPSRRDRLLNGLRQDGYQGFMNVIWTLPAIGSISTQSAKVDVKYAWETMVQNRRRLVVVADKPLFFLARDAQGRAGYDLTVVELQFDDRNGATGTMAGAARVKPSPDEGLVLQDYSAVPVQLTVLPPSK